jgi:hypothetical protein
MNADEHKFHGARKRFSRRTAGSPFGGSILTDEKAHHPLSHPRLSASIRGSNGIFPAYGKTCTVGNIWHSGDV